MSCQAVQVTGGEEGPTSLVVMTPTVEVQAESHREDGEDVANEQSQVKYP